jgi:phage virion morphogenesis protein
VLSLKVNGLLETRKALADMAERTRDLTPAMQAGAEAIKKFVDDRFHTSTDPLGRPWKALAAKTVSRRRRGSRKPLVDTARLRNSVHADPTDETIRWGTNVEYAGTHQLGSKARNIPARSFLPVVKTGSNTFAVIEAGPAGKMWERVRGYIESYIATGKVK